ncbi:hypothetical protein Vretimale_17449 [Volvox reticuliferus]|uniref:Uncharacterized protein n=1 Tax=Volvox reticuliferus TaxID=1737510 RepID=A0A8J4GT24_9CHLO|nr:hypothetical protein Vretimale_17449 [Volvox reticuliferus]
MMSLAKNRIVQFHMDINDAHWTLIVWLHGGIGPIINGCFGLPALGLRFLPTTLTVALFNAASITHGTEECIIPEGSSACRFGSSHFLRTPDLENLICLRLGAESKGLTLEELKEAAGARGASASSICALRTELIAAGKAEFRLDTDGQKAWKDPAVDWRDYV